MNDAHNRRVSRSWPIQLPVYVTHWGRDKMAAIFQMTFSNGFSWLKIMKLISINISLKFVSRGPINNIPTLVQVMAWRRPGDKSLSEPMMVTLPTHICVTRPQWVNVTFPSPVTMDYIPISGGVLLEMQEPNVGWGSCPIRPSVYGTRYQFGYSNLVIRYVECSTEVL